MLYPIPPLSGDTSPIPRTCLSFSLGLAGSPQCPSMVLSSSHCPPVPVQTSCIELTSGFLTSYQKSFLSSVSCICYLCDLRSSYIFIYFLFFLCPLTQGWWRRHCSPQYPHSLSRAWHIVDTF